MPRLIRHALLLFAATVAFAQSDRDFSGKWYFKPKLSELDALPEHPEPILRIEQANNTVHVFRADDKTEFRTYATDGRVTSNSISGTRYSTQTKWEGAAFLTNTIVTTPDTTYTIAGRWRLSRDRQRLTLTIHIIRANTDNESTLVYEREQGAASPPKLITSAPPAAGPPEPKPVENAPPRAVETASLPSPSGATPAAPEPNASMAAPQTETPAPDFIVARGTDIPLRLTNSIDTKHSSAGDRVYLQTVYPVLSHGKMVIPPGSYVMGTLRQVEQAGRAKGRSSFSVEFDSLTLPNGTTRDFHSRLSSVDADAHGKLDRNEGVVRGDGRRGSDAAKVGAGAATGTIVGAAIGGASGHLGAGAGIGAAAGALTGLAAALSSRGPDAVLPRGTTVEMVLDRDLTFTRGEVLVR